MSSEIVDFSFTTSAGDSYTMNAFGARSESPSITSSSNAGDSLDEDEQEDNFQEDDAPLVRCGEKVKPVPQESRSESNSRKRPDPSWLAVRFQLPSATRDTDTEPQRKKKRVDIEDRKQPVVDSNQTSGGKPAILDLGCDVMAHVLTFLEPPDILDVLTMPISKDWVNVFTRQPEIWRVLCLLEPFKAQVEEGYESTDDSDAPVFNKGRKEVFGKYRLLYTSFVRCMRYLMKIKDDAIHGRPPSVIDYAPVDSPRQNIITNQNLQQFLARARGVVGAATSTAQDPATTPRRNHAPIAQQVARVAPINLSDDESLANNYSSYKKGRKQRKR
jgi:hypothetical protein